jgi:hypothetical protein
MTQTEEGPQLIYKDESYAIIGACFAVSALMEEHRAQLLNYLTSEIFVSFRVFSGPSISNLRF